MKIDRPELFSKRTFLISLSSGLLIILTAMLQAPRTSVAQNAIAADASKQEESAVGLSAAKTSNPVLNLFSDLTMGLCDEKTAKKRAEALGVKDFKNAMGEELDVLKSDLLGIRQVTAKQFAAIVKSMEIVSSGHVITPIGVSKDKAYLEVKIFLTSKLKNVVVVTTPLADLPKDLVERIRKMK